MSMDEKQFSLSARCAKIKFLSVARHLLASLFLGSALGIISNSARAEPAWWTQQKKDCGLPASLAYNTWVAQGSPCNASTPSSIYEFLPQSGNTVAVQRRDSFQPDVFIAGYGRISGRTVERKFERKVTSQATSIPGTFKGVLSQDNQTIEWTGQYEEFPERSTVLKREP